MPTQLLLLLAPGLSDAAAAATEVVRDGTIFNATSSASAAATRAAAKSPMRSATSSARRSSCLPAAQNVFAPHQRVCAAQHVGTHTHGVCLPEHMPT